MACETVRPGRREWQIHEEPGTRFTAGSEGASFNGKIIDALEYSPQGFQGDRFAVGVEYADATADVVLGQLPTDPITLPAPFYRQNLHVFTQGQDSGGTHIGQLRYDIDLAQFRSDGLVPVVAPCAGQVFISPESESGGMGNQVHLVIGDSPRDPSKKLVLDISHMRADLRVTDGEWVEAGTLLGIESNTGVTYGETGVHIDLGVFEAANPAIGNAFNGWTPVGWNPGELAMLLEVPPASTAQLYDNSNFEDIGVGWVVGGTIDRPANLAVSGQLDQGESRSNSLVLAERSDLAYSLVWPGSEFTLEIFAPDGVLAWTITETGGLIEGSIPAASPGVWTFRTTANLTSGPDEPFTLATDVRAIPEPATVWLAIAAALACAFQRVAAQRLHGTKRMAIGLTIIALAAVAGAATNNCAFAGIINADGHESTPPDHPGAILDLDTGLLWLDATKTTNRSFDDISAKLDPFEEFDGWRYATNAELRELGSNAGITDILGDWAEDMLLPIEALQSIWGVTFTTGDNRTLVMTADETSFPNWKDVGLIRTNVDSPPAGNGSAQLPDRTQHVAIGNSYIGSALVRLVVPEPSSWFLLSIAGIGLVMWRPATGAASCD